MKIRKISRLLVLLASSVFADTFSPNAQYQLCFRPYQNCLSEIVTAIDGAQTSIFVQAYSFDSKPLIEALINAKQRGLDVKVIMDNHAMEKDAVNVETKKKLMKANIPVWIDDKLHTAHNKVIIIDNTMVETGSFNFTENSAEKNAENVLIIKDPKLANQYLQNWYQRQTESKFAK